MSGHDRGVFSRRTENVLSVLLIVAAVVMAWRFWLSNETPTVSRQPTIVGEWRAFGDGGNRLESPNLPVTMVVFSDYESPTVGDYGMRLIVYYRIRITASV